MVVRSSGRQREILRPCRARRRGRGQPGLSSLLTGSVSRAWPRPRRRFGTGDCLSWRRGLLDQAVPARRGCRPTCTGKSAARVITYTMVVSAADGPDFRSGGRRCRPDGLNLQEMLRDGASRDRDRAGAARRLRNALVIIEVSSLTDLGLLGASLFVHSFLNLQGGQPLAFATGHRLLTAPLLHDRRRLCHPLKQEGAAPPTTSFAAVEALPGVLLPFASNFHSARRGRRQAVMRSSTARARARRGDEPAIVLHCGDPPISTGTMGLSNPQGPRFPGRGKAPKRRPVAVINQTMAGKTCGRGTDAIGQRLPAWSRPSLLSGSPSSVIAPDIRPTFDRNDNKAAVLRQHNVPYRFSGALKISELTIRAGNNNPAAAGRAAVQKGN